MEELILVVGESSKNAGTEFWYTQNGIQKQLDILEKGTHPLHANSDTLRFILIWRAGELSELHRSKFRGDELTPAKLRRIKGQLDVKKSSVFNDDPHEGGPGPDSAGDGFDTVLFVPGFCY
jgi:hypothetical protein